MASGSWAGWALGAAPGARPSCRIAAPGASPASPGGWFQPLAVRPSAWARAGILAVGPPRLGGADLLDSTAPCALFRPRRPSFDGGPAPADLHAGPVDPPDRRRPPRRHSRAQAIPRPASARSDCEMRPPPTLALRRVSPRSRVRNRGRKPSIPSVLDPPRPARSVRRQRPDGPFLVAKRASSHSNPPLLEGRIGNPGGPASVQGDTPRRGSPAPALTGVAIRLTPFG